MTNESCPAAPRFNPWPYAILAWFAFAITVAVVFTAFAVRQEFDLVRPDYYEEELRHQRRIDSVKRTAALGEAVSLRHDRATQRLRLTIPATHAGARGEVHLYRPSDAGLDVRLPLETDADGVQWIDAAAVKTGLWRVRVQWTAGGEEFFLEQSVVIPAKDA
jgi:nitrogen fixation protein FixH